MMEGMKGKEKRDGESAREGLIGRGYGGWGGGLPSILSGCGSPLWTSSHRHPQLMNQTWFLEELRLYISVLARTKHTSINILAFFLSQC